MQQEFSFADETAAGIYASEPRGADQYAAESPAEESPNPLDPPGDGGFKKHIGDSNEL